MFFKAPLSALLDVNSSCQLRCKYCSAMPFDGTNVPIERTVDLLKELGKLQVWYLSFSGGEPFLHPGIMTFIETAFEAGIATTINTNGLRLLEDTILGKLVQLKANGVKFMLSMSLDSPDPIANNSGRGRGKEAAEAIHRSLKAGLDVRISSVVHAGTVNTALEMPEVFKGAKNYTFFPMYSTWSSQQKGEDLIAEERVLQDFWRRAAELQQRYGENLITLPFRKHDRQREASVMNQNNHITCFCAFSKCFIDSHLNVYPCDMTRTSSLCLGNLMNSTFLSVWNGPAAHRIREEGKKERLCKRTPVLNSSGDLSIRYSK